MTRIAIVEDEPRASDLLSGYLNRFSEENRENFVITEYRNAPSFLDQYQSGFDIILLDIEMPYMNGMDMARKLREIDSEVIIIFVTNMAQFAVKGYEVDALDFIVKPVSYSNFVFKMKRALNALKVNEEQEIVVSYAGGLTRISSNKLLYVEVSGHNVTYHLIDKKIEARGSLSKIESDLSKWNFLRCNRCYLVNPRYVEWVHKYTVKVGDDVLQISHPKRKEFMRDLNDWLAKGGK
ncbi:LytR/AlgR family response regulator transcription factor [Radiobacillus sp. PE A8.2]|uniref:LytR/AlgR family response regulator transcription factor n=1 Tax=Radiobacillus sp. PE A8.2 TaxID=3380349 RepID=UPI003890564B